MKSLIILVVKTTLLLVLVVLIINIFIYLATKDYIYDSVLEAPNVGVVLIPGAAVLKDGTLSPIFADRVNTAILLYESGKATKILVSGDNSTIYYNEVNPVRNYLLARGVLDTDIYLDHAGFDTYSSMYRARDIFGIESVLISTQSFHLPRAVFIARSLGIKAFGVNADEGNILFKNYLREVLANVKAVMNIVLRTKPKYLGEEIPITDV